MLEVGDIIRLKSCGTIVTVEETNYTDWGGGFSSFWSSELINAWYTDSTTHTNRKNWHNASDVYIEILNHDNLSPLKKMKKFTL